MTYKKVYLLFDSAWLDAAGSDKTATIKKVIEGIAGCFVSDVETLSIASDYYKCEIVIKTSNLTEEMLDDRIKGVLVGQFSVEEDKAGGIITTAIENISSKELEEIKKKSNESTTPLKTEEAGAEEEIPSATGEIVKQKREQEKAPTVPAEEIIGSKKTALEKINALVGATEFKQLAAECVQIAPQVVKYGSHESFGHQCYLFAINDGYGLSTYLEYFADLLDENKLYDFGSGSSTKVMETKLLAPGSVPDPFEPATSRLGRFGKSGGKLLCIDMSEWMSKTSDKNFRNFLAQVEDSSSQNIIVFRVPFVEKEILNGIRRNLGDQLFIRDVSFVPLSTEELIVCAKESLEQRKFTADEDVWKVFEARVAEEKRDGKFYGINTVNKIIREMVYYKLLSNAMAGVDNNHIKKDEILRLANTYNDNELTGTQMLDELVGMDAIKKRIEEIVAQIEISRNNASLGSPCIHMRFVGNPGTGKTTAARIIGKILREKGILRNGNFFEYAGRDFCGRYVGETAPKTAGMCRDAYGSVMFIDEAYSLYSDTTRGTADYGKEAIDTLIAEMENHRSDLVVIMAGYPDEMDTLMKANAGLESRMPFVIEFPNYDRDQLFVIFMKMAEKSFSFEADFRDAVKSYFDELPDEFINAKEFSNARFVRNLFERTWGKAVLRCQLEHKSDISLTKEDFVAACSDGEFQKNLNNRKGSLGFAL